MTQNPTEPKIIAKMPDDTLYLGVSPETGKPFYRAPALRRTSADARGRHPVWYNHGVTIPTGQTVFSRRASATTIHLLSLADKERFHQLLKAEAARREDETSAEGIATKPQRPRRKKAQDSNAYSNGPPRLRLLFGMEMPQRAFVQAGQARDYTTARIGALVHSKAKNLTVVFQVKCCISMCGSIPPRPGRPHRSSQLSSIGTRRGISFAIGIASTTTASLCGSRPWA
jgi:hypothetical protein